MVSSHKKNVLKKQYKKTHTLIQKAITSPLIKSIQHKYYTLQNIGRIRGWTITEYYRQKLLKTLLKNEIKNLQEKTWKK